MNIFVTGTDTGVGKTLISCALLHAFKARGKRVLGMKPVACGCDHAGLHEDVERLIAAANVSAERSLVNPFRFSAPVAPHIAAQQAGLRIGFEPILQACRQLASQADVVIVEGIGGYRVPLNEREDSADLAVQLGLPVILIVGMRLGCLNHALLTADAIARGGLPLAGWVANLLDADMAAQQQNIAALQQRLPAPLLGVSEYQRNPDARMVSRRLNLDLLDTGKKQ